jgi:hypothetical protein
MPIICGTVRTNSSDFRDHALEKLDILPCVSGLALKGRSRMKIINSASDAKENPLRRPSRFSKSNRIEVFPTSGVDAMRANIRAVVSLQ